MHFIYIDNKIDLKYVDLFIKYVCGNLSVFI